MPEPVGYVCQVHPCRTRKGETNHWFVVTIDAEGRFIVDKFTKPEHFARAAKKWGAQEVCSERCLHVHLGRWAAGQITALNRPECASEAVMTDKTLTAWVSTVYRDLVIPGRPTRKISYRDNGREQAIWCFNQAAFERVERTIGTHATFKIQRRRGDYYVAMDVLTIDGQDVSQQAIANK